MDAGEAKNIVARFLTNDDVSENQVSQACELLAGESLEHLRDEFGLYDDWMSDCRVFREHLAEFCEMAPITRETELPELSVHFGDCAACRTLFWQVASPWTSLGSDEGIAAYETRRWPPIIVSFKPKKGLVDRGQGPPCASIQFYAKAAEAGTVDDVDVPTGLSWEIVDEEYSLRVYLRVRLKAPGLYTLETELKGAEPLEDSRKNVRLLLRKGLQDEVFFAGDVTDLTDDPLEIEPGEWRVSLVSTDAEGERKWEIVLIIEGAS